MMTIKNIRSADKNDLDEIYNLICVLENKTFDKNSFTEVYFNALQGKVVFCFVAEIENKVVGFTSVSILDLLHHSGKVLEIQELVVDENHRSRGIGKDLIDFIIKFAIKNKCLTIDVTSNKKRLAAHRFYENLGFKSSHFKFTLDLN
jgi:(aminoalkyl)phosphonate N-acetyltransferase